MKKLLYVFLFGVVSNFTIYAQSSSVQQALQYIEQGYVKYGLEQLTENANLKDTWAQFFLARCLETGYAGIIEHDPVAAFKLYRTVSEKGLPVGQKCVSDCYRQGIGTGINIAKAEMWAQKCNSKYNNYELTYIYQIIDKGLTHPELLAINPSENKLDFSNGIIAMAQNNGSVNSNNTVSSNNQTINNITIVQSAQTEPNSFVSAPQKASITRSDVDQNIPVNTQKNENAFALIIANENYQDVAKVPNAINDGEIFAEYCQKALGLPASNVTLVKDATYNNIKREINKLTQIASAYKGSAKILFYYAGHGIPNEATKDAFLLPVDGYGTDTSTGYSLKELYSTLGNMPAEQIVVLLDACFSGSQRGDGMLASARGVAIKAKPNKTEGKVVVLSAAQGDETAYPYTEEGHGLFTYYLLKKLKESKGDVSLGDLASYIKDNVSKKSIVVNGKSQTPNVNPSASLGESWKSWTLK